MAREVETVRLASLSVVVFANVALALFVFLRNRRKSANRAFATAVFTIVLWLVLAFLCDQPAFADWALTLNRVDLASASSSEKEAVRCPPGGGSSCSAGASSRS